MSKIDKKQKYNKLVEIATSKGGRVLFDRYLGSKTKVLWACGCGHQWLAIPNNVENGSWCPNCSSGLSERICRDLFKNILNKDFQKLRPKWLIVDGKRLELDGYCPELGIAFEHNGIQHYKTGLFCDDLKKRQYYDQEKIKLCKAHGVKLIIIPALFVITPIEELKKLVIAKLKSFGVYNINENVSVNYVSGFIDYQTQLLRVKDIAKSRGGECMSTRYLGWNKKLIFKCKCGYTWRATPSAIKRGTWCPKCAKRPKIHLDYLQNLAKSRGGLLLSSEYINNHTKMTWQCSKKHTWESSYNNIQKHWCPVCSAESRSKSKRIPIDVYRKAAKKKGGKCLSKSVSSCYDKLEFECAKGHKWFGRADQIKNTSQWCPICANKRQK